MRKFVKTGRVISKPSRKQRTETYQYCLKMAHNNVNLQSNNGILIAFRLTSSESKCCLEEAQGKYFH